MNQGEENMLSFPVQDAFFVIQNEKEIQEIDEIELTPVVSIQETDDDITISGYLLLAGKYIGKQEGPADPFINKDSSEGSGYIDSVRFNPFALEPVDYTEEEIELITFAHRTPVHIRIPRERVENIKDVYATISAFDYDIQSSRKLTITAELALNGITQFMEPPAADTEEVEEEMVDRGEESRIVRPGINAEWLVAGDVFALTEQETDKEPEAKVDNVSDAHVEQEETDTSDEESEEEVEEENKEETEEEKSAITHHAIKEIKAEEKVEERPAEASERASTAELSKETLATEAEEERTLIQEESESRIEKENPAAEIPEEEQEPEEEVREEVREEAKVAITLKGTKSDPVTVHPSTLFAARSNEQGSEEEAASPAYPEEIRAASENASTEEEEQPVEKDRESALYLTTFMSKEETYTRLKMCIAQYDETLDAIAERYSVSTADIAQANGLHTNVAIAKGQVLYIPVRS